jgi:hypothetical protein
MKGRDRAWKDRAVRRYGRLIDYGVAGLRDGRRSYRHEAVLQFAVVLMRCDRFCWRALGS